MTARTAPRTVAVIGAGPVGLAAAAHLVERGLTPIVLEAGDGPGAAIRQWGHVRLFSPWRFDIDSAARRLLEAHGWVAPDLDGLPTGAELIGDYLAPLAQAPEIAPHVRYGHKVTAVSRLGVDKTRTIGREGRPYLVRTRTAAGARADLVVDAVIDASGTWGRPNPLGAAGLPAAGEAQAAPWLAGPLPDVLGRDRARFAGRRVLVVGMGHSAANTLLALVRLQAQEPATRISWVVRAASPTRLYGGGKADQLPARGALGGGVRDAVRSGAVTLLTGTTITALRPAADGSLRVELTRAGEHNGLAADVQVVLDVDVLVGAVGFRPDLDMLREVRLDLHPALEAPAGLAPLIDPNFHSCGTVPPHGASLLAHPDEGFYLVGMKSYGRAPTFLLATGYEQVRSIAAALAGDQEAADRVDLQLPETGACGTKAAPLDSEPAGLGFATGTAHGHAGQLLAAVGGR